MFLGIEIGGTKLQLGVGRGDGRPLVALERFAVDPSQGAEAIRRQIAAAGGLLLREHPVRGMGIGFGGPVDSARGCPVTSFHVRGWDSFPIVEWCRNTFGLPVVLANDADTAGLAEARFGAGRGRRVVFYVTVGSGIGGGLFIDGRPYLGGCGIASELGHLRPGLHARRRDQTVEAVASGWGIANNARASLASSGDCSVDRDAAELLSLCGGDPSRLDARMIAAAAAKGNELAQDALRDGCRTLGWAIAQVISLLGPNAVVIGGGVSLIGEELFFAPLRREVARYVYGPLSNAYSMLAAALGEEVVVHGALALAREADTRRDGSHTTTGKEEIT